MGLPWWLRWLRICLRCKRPRFTPWVGKIPWRRKWQPTPVLLPRGLHGQRNLVGYSPWGHKESATTERLTLSLFHFLLISVLSIPFPLSEEGNGTPLQYSRLENPMDGGAWWAAVHGVAKSGTWLSDFSFTFHFYALEKEMATYSSVLAWRIPGTGSHRVRHNWSDLAVSLKNWSER